MVRRFTAIMCIVLLVLSAVPVGAFAAERTEDGAAGSVKSLVIDGNTVNTAKNSVWRGFGIVSANNSSRLLLDYKYESPEAYRRLLGRLFSPDGPVRADHLKIEMGADINSSSGTEPSTMRSAEDAADVKRGAGFRLAADAKTINPDLELELLSWGAPAFVKNAETEEQRFELRYKWFKDTLDAAYMEYDLKFDYIDPNYNEKGVDKRWIKYFAERLRTENNSLYDFSEIKIVAADENASYNLASMMERDSELMDAVDVIGIHYTSTSDEATLSAKNDHGKELWYSEGLAPAMVEKYAVCADGSGLGGVNSVLDVAGRIVNMYPNGGFTMYAFQPAVAAYYSGATYFPKQLITANEPWSGYTEVGAGVYMCEHFSLFTGRGWQFVDSGCFGDGREENHVLYDTTDNYMTLTDPSTGDYSTIFVNNTDAARSYDITVKNLKRASKTVSVWETRGPDAESRYNSNYMKNILKISPVDNGGGEYSYKLTVKPRSMVTVSTLSVTAPDLSVPEEYERLALPYSDDFDYADYDETYIEARGGTPRYTTDLGGAFEIAEDEIKGHVLRQMITEDMRGQEWGSSPEPVTTFGDDTWSNYSVITDVKFDPDARTDPALNYVGVGLRYINASTSGCRSGYWIKLSADGSWALMHMAKAIKEGRLDTLDTSAWHTLGISAAGDVVTAQINGSQVASVRMERDVTFSGRGAFFSAYFRNSFDDLRVTPLDSVTNYVNRIDELDASVTYAGEWEHNTMDSFTMHNRTGSACSGAGSVRFTFEGDSLAVIGKSKDGTISVTIDGKPAASGVSVSSTTNKAALWYKYSLGYGTHDVELSVDSGTVVLDAFEYGSRTRLKNGDPEGGELTAEEDIPLAERSEEESTEQSAKKTSPASLPVPLMVGAGIAFLILAGSFFRRNR